MTPKIDLIDGGYFESAEIRRATRFAIVTDIPTTNPSAVLVLATNASGMPQVGDRHPVRPECTLRSLETFSVESGSAVKLRLIYESPRVQTPSGGGGSSRWVIEDSTSLTTQSSNVVPGIKPGKDKVPLLLKYMDDKTEKWFPGDTATITFLRALRTVTLSGTLDAGQGNDIYAAVGCVNSDDWQGKPPGYWLFSGIDSTTVDGGKTKGMRLAFTTRNREDWSEYIFLRHQQTGKVISGPEVDAAITELASKTYAYGITYPQAGNRRGVAKVGPYVDIPFFSVFGI